MDVREAMTAPAVTVSLRQTIGEAAAIMRRGRFRHLPVVQSGALAGVISERDLHTGDGTLSEDEHRRRPLRAVMTADVITIAAHDPIEQAARLMLENKVGCLPVMEQDAVVGIITESDIFRAFVRTLGVMEPGTRVQIRAPDLASALEQIAGAARTRGVRVISIISEPPATDGSCRLVVRFGTLLIAPLIAALRESGLSVEEPEPGRAGAMP